MVDVSLLIVHYNTPGLLMQTLKGIARANIRCSYEVLVVDNNPNCRIVDQVKERFPDVRVLVSDQNKGFGGGMNMAMDVARGRYFFVFNPDMVMFEGVVEQLVAFMDAHPDIGMAGPKLLHPDRTLQDSCYRFSEPKTIAYRRIPLLRNQSFAKAHVDHYLMREWDHSHVRDVDYLLGASLFVRRSAKEAVGGFDPNYFVYFEDQDWCRRFWKAGWRVVYYPDAHLVHYHRRETAKGSFLKQLLNPLTRIQLKSALYYYKTFRGEPNPREVYLNRQSRSTQ